MNTRILLKSEPGNHLVCELGALLHDIADQKFHDRGPDFAPRKAIAFLEKEHLPDEDISRVVDIIRHISFSSELNGNPVKSVDLRIVQDADRLDAIGAVGIARAFNYGGFKSHPLHDPLQRPRSYRSAEEYLASPSSTINHFHEKLLLLKDRMNTGTARRMAEERHAFMLLFLDRFQAEWEGRPYSLPAAPEHR